MVLSYLFHTDSVENKIAIERLVADIDSRMLNSATKVEYNSVTFWDKVKQTYNLVAAKKGLDYRTATLFVLMKISTLARKDLDELYYKVGRGKKEE